MLTIAQSAKIKIANILSEENNPTLRVRAFVQGGGCQGFSYGFTLAEQQNEDDFEVDGILVDSMSMQYMIGAVIEYREDDMGASFVITNPNAVTTCGCGSSFTTH